MNSVQKNSTNYISAGFTRFKDFLEGKEVGFLENEYKGTTLEAFEDTYELTNEQLGSGSFGTVFLAKRKAIRTRIKSDEASLFIYGDEEEPHVAVKVIKRKDVKDSTLKRGGLWQMLFPPKKGKSDWGDLTKEVNILKTVKHEHIIRLFDHFHDDEKLYIVFEIAKGGDLLECMTKRRMEVTESDIRDVIHRVLSALDFLFKLGFVHRDLKSDNLFLKNENDLRSVVLGDFGFAKHYKMEEHTETLLETICGTKAYLAPEVSSGSYNFKCDIWSLGCVAYFLLSGYMPHGFSAMDNQVSSLEVSARFDSFQENGIRNEDDLEPQEPWKNFSQSSKDFIFCCLTVDVEERADYDTLKRHSWFSKIKDESYSKYYETVIEIGPLKAYLARRKALKVVKIGLAENAFLELQSSQSLPREPLGEHEQLMEPISMLGESIDTIASKMI
eukprot:augustus_masked-scaffold_5-processed-gene-1.6-mRNA-1 protein AED:0.14 eAED:0.81 QI:0/-1/0/1/-1/1/1/0/442